MRFNLSEWALRHRSFVVYCMIALMVAGVMSYYRLGRNEDPVFTFRTMVVQAAWPGATLQETLDLVTERIEDTLKETPRLDFLRSYTSAGVTTIFVTLKGSTPPREVPDIWYHVRKSVGDIRHTLPAGVVGPGFNDEFGDTFGIIYGFTADGFTHHELRDHVEKIRTRLLRLADVSKVEIMGAQDEKILIEFSTEKLAGLGIDRGDLDRGTSGTECGQPCRHPANRGREARAAGLGRIRIRIRHPGYQYRFERPLAPPGRHCRRQTGLRRSAATHVPGEWETGHRRRHRHARWR